MEWVQPLSAVVCVVSLLVVVWRLEKDRRFREEWVEEANRITARFKEAARAVGAHSLRTGRKKSAGRRSDEESAH